MKILVPLAAIVAYALTFAAIAIWPPLLLLVLLVTWPFDRNRRVAGRFLRILAAFISRTFPFWRLRFEGEVPRGKEAHVVVANHQSFLDIFVLSNLPREMKWVAKDSLFRIPWVGWCFYLSGDIPVNRGDPKSAAKVYERCKDYLEHGMNVMLFPEGTRSRDGELLPFKAGAFKMAIDLGMPVLPIALCGSAEGMPKGSPWVRPTTVRVKILEPVSTQGMTDRDLRALRDGVRDRIDAAVKELRARTD